jgi:hypothetical protein
MFGAVAAGPYAIYHETPQAICGHQISVAIAQDFHIQFAYAGQLYDHMIIVLFQHAHECTIDDPLIADRRSSGISDVCTTGT